MQNIIDIWNKNCEPKERLHSLQNVHRNSDSPWGRINRVDYITPWLTQVHTPSHGGYKVDKVHNKFIPEQYRSKESLN